MSNSSSDLPKSKEKRIVITIETCNKKPKSSNKTDRDWENCKCIDKSTSTTENDEKTENKDNESKNKEPKPKSKREQLPVLPPRVHTSGCVMEVNILEKHKDNCPCRKDPNNARNPLEDRVGSYECVGRMIFKTCSVESIKAGKSGATKSAPKSKLNSKESEPIIIEDDSSSDVAHSKNGKKDDNSNGKKSKTDDFQAKDKSDEKSSIGSDKDKSNSPKRKSATTEADDSVSVGGLSKKSTASDAREVAIYHLAVQQPILAHTSGRSPHGNKQHYAGDGCKLHFPIERQTYHAQPGDANLRASLRMMASSPKKFEGSTDASNQFPSHFSMTPEPKIEIKENLDQPASKHVILGDDVQPIKDQNHVSVAESSPPSIEKSDESDKEKFDPKSRQSFKSEKDSLMAYRLRHLATKGPEDDSFGSMKIEEEEKQSDEVKPKKGLSKFFSKFKKKPSNEEQMSKGEVPEQRSKKQPEAANVKRRKSSVGIIKPD